MNRNYDKPARTKTLLPARNSIALLFDCLAHSLLVLETWRTRHASSMQVARVEARVLRDAGISDAQRFIAMNKPFWEK